MPRGRMHPVGVIAPIFLLPLALLCLPEAPQAAGICPPGSSSIETGNPRAPWKCARGALGGATGKVERWPQPPASPSCPPGMTEVQTDSSSQPYICAAIKTADADAPGDCEVFNAGFDSFYKNESSEYTALARDHYDDEVMMRRVIEDQQTLSRELKIQARQERSPDVRRHLTSQARAVEHDIRGRTNRLRSLRQNNRAREGSRKNLFRSRAASLLQNKPRGCAVKAAKTFTAEKTGN